MTATDELRRLLDERGVEWADQFGPFPVTAYKTHYVVWIAKEYTDGLLSIETRPVTPEQAIAATLGGDERATRTLTADDVLNAVYKHGARWQAIADELNATLGGGECKWVWVESWTDTTDGRECDYAHWMPDCGCWSEGDYRFSDFDDYEEKPTGIVFCERCGKAVKR